MQMGYSVVIGWMELLQQAYNLSQPSAPMSILAQPPAKPGEQLQQIVAS